MPPAPPASTLQVTCVLPVPVTVAANCTPCPAGTVAVGGFTETVTGSSVIVVAALLVVSAALTAVTVTVCWVGTRVGAVYTPVLETLPIPLGAALHATYRKSEERRVGKECRSRWS